MPRVITATDTARPRRPASPQLVSPKPSDLAAFLTARLANERGDTACGELPPGVSVDNRPQLPRVGGQALGLYLRRRAVDSYPLIFTALALAHPN